MFFVINLFHNNIIIYCFVPNRLIILSLLYHRKSYTHITRTVLYKTYKTPFKSQWHRLLGKFSIRTSTYLDRNTYLFHNDYNYGVINNTDGAAWTRWTESNQPVAYDTKRLFQRRISSLGGQSTKLLSTRQAYAWHWMNKILVAYLRRI